MRDYFSILPCKVQLQIEYINKRRVQSTRIVDVQSFVANSPDGMMVGFCHTRKMARSFSYSGITSATDTQSGEIIDTWIYTEGLGKLNYSLSTAVGLLKSVISFMLVFATNRLARKWECAIW